jgi:branched-chain amino acid transport system substrate-binding protein
LGRDSGPPKGVGAKVADTELITQEHVRFLAVGGWDSMAAIFHAIKSLHGKVDDAGKVMATLKGWSSESPRGPITIDAKSRDIIQDEHVEEVYKKADGSLGVKVLDTIPAVKDPCKEHKIGRCK